MTLYRIGVSSATIAIFGIAALMCVYSNFELAVLVFALAFISLSYSFGFREKNGRIEEPSISERASIGSFYCGIVLGTIGLVNFIVVSYFMDGLGK